MHRKVSCFVYTWAINAQQWIDYGLRTGSGDTEWAW